MELNYGMSLEQKQQLSQNQIQSLEVLAMDSVELSEFLQDEYLENPLLDYSEEHAMPGGREDIGQTYEQPPVLEQNYDDTAEKEDRRRFSRGERTVCSAQGSGDRSRRNA